MSSVVLRLKEQL